MKRFREPGYTQIPNDLLDNIQDYSEGDLRVLLAIFRATIGSGCKTVCISGQRLAERTGLHRATVCESVKSLRQLGVLVAEQEDPGQPNTYRVNVAKVGL